MEVRAAPDDLKRRAVVGAVWSAAQAWGARTLSLVVFTILGRLLDPDAFGLVALAVVFVELGRVFVEGGFTRAIVQHENPDQQHLDTALWVSLAVGVAFGGLMALSASTLAAAYGEPRLTPVLQLLALAFPLSAITGVPMALLQRQFEFRAIAARRLIAAVVSGAVAIIMAAQGAGVYSLVAQTLVNTSVASIIVWIAVDWRPRFGFSGTHFRSLFGFGIHLVGFNLVAFAQNRGDDFLIGTFLGPVSLGYYFVAFRVLAILAELLASTIAMVAFPTFSRLVNDPPRLRRAFLASIRMTLAIAVPAFVGLALVADDVLIGVFGERWRPAVPAMRLLALEGVSVAVGRFNWYLLMAVGRPNRAFQFAFLRAATLMGAVALALPWGFVGAAAAVVIHAYLFLPVPVWAVGRAIDLDVRRYWRQFGAPTLATGVMVLIVGASRILTGDLDPLVRLGTSVGVGAVGYVAVLRVIAPRLIAEVREYARIARPGGRDVVVVT